MSCGNDLPSKKELLQREEIIEKLKAILSNLDTKTIDLSVFFEELEKLCNEFKEKYRFKIRNHLKTAGLKKYCSNRLKNLQYQLDYYRKR